MKPRDDVVDAISDLLSALLGAFERVAWVQRQLYPPHARALADELVSAADALRAALEAVQQPECPEELRFIRDRLDQVARDTVDLATAFVDAARSSGGPLPLYAALRRFASVQERLYPLAPVLESVSRWFLEPARRDDAALIARLREAALRDDGPRVGVLHANNDHGTRGGFSLYVPETWDGSAAMPLIVALHGGHGHGRDFLWTWVREARSRGILALAPTSVDRTWSILGEDVDAARITEMVEFIGTRYRVDRERVLLTGMSDGATYALLCGLREKTPFTHLAPACGVLHPMLVAGGLARAAGRPIYLVHGALDWMFPVSTARAAREALRAAGARLVYREIADLSHTYPREENARILDWLTRGNGD